MRPAVMKRSLALFTVFLKVFSACFTVLVSPASARYLSQASAYRAQSAFIEVDVGSPRPFNRGQIGVDGDEDGQMIAGQ